VINQSLDTLGLHIKRICRVRTFQSVKAREMGGVEETTDETASAQVLRNQTKRNRNQRRQIFFFLVGYFCCSGWIFLFVLQVSSVVTDET